MNPGILNSIAVTGQIFPLKLLKARKNLPSFLPFYHVVNEATPDYINSYVVRTPRQFEVELDYLVRHFKPVGLEEIVNAPDKNKMHLSFDDGLKACSTVIAPILKRKGIPATFFVSPGFTNNQQLFHRFKRAILEAKGVLTKGEKQYYISDVTELDELALKHNIDFSEWRPYMTMEELVTLNNDGFSIGAHSLNHPEMWMLNEEEQFSQITGSMQWVIDHFNPEIKAFSFPFTDDGIKRSLFDRLNNSGLVDVTFGTAGLKHDDHPINLQRIPVELKQKWSIQKVVHFQYFYYFLRSIIGKNTVIH